MTQDDFHRDILTPFIARHGVDGAAKLLGKRRNYMQRVYAGRLPITHTLAKQFGQTLTGAVEKTPYNSARHCPDCHAVTYHRRVHMDQLPGCRAVQCKECRVVTIDLQKG